MASELRPLERRLLRWREQGVGFEELAPRFRRSPEFLERVEQLTSVPRHGGDGGEDTGLRPLERRILRWREKGAAFEELAPRFRRSPAFLEQVEQLALYKLAQA
jgi:hypothetical protein